MASTGLRIRLDPVEGPGPYADGGAQPLPQDRFSNRELSWLAFNARVLALAEDRAPAAAGTGEVPGHLRQQPRRVLHGARRRAEAAPAPWACRCQSVDGLSQREHAGRAGRAHPRAGRPARPLLPRRRRSRRWPTRASASCAGPTSTTRTRPGWPSYFRSQDLPGAHAARRRPGAPVPVHLRTVAEPGRHRARPRSGAQRFARVKVPNNVPPLRRVPETARPTSAFIPLEDLIAAHLGRCSSPAWRSWSTTCSGSPATPTSRSRRTATRTCAGPRTGAAATPVRSAGPPRDRRRHRRRRRSTCSSSELDVTEQEVLRVPGPLGPRRAVPDLRASTGPALKYPPFVPATASPLRRRRDARSRLRHARATGRAGSPPIRVVRHQRAALHRAGRRRPERARHQADPVPHQR